jgi:hypothetical protein
MYGFTSIASPSTDADDDVVDVVVWTMTSSTSSSFMALDVVEMKVYKHSYARRSHKKLRLSKVTLKQMQKACFQSLLNVLLQLVIFAFSGIKIFAFSGRKD